MSLVAIIRRVLMMTIHNNPIAALTEYELRYLVAHQAVAGWGEDLHHLLVMETGEGRNAWYEAKEATVLRQAQLDMLVDFPDPYYWSGFILSGDGGEGLTGRDNQTALSTEVS